MRIKPTADHAGYVRTKDETGKILCESVFSQEEIEAPSDPLKTFMGSGEKVFSMKTICVPLG